MSTLKRKGVDSSVHESCPQAKRSVTINTVNKWIAENDKKLSTTTWLCYDKANRDCVSALKCSVCIRFQDKLRSDKNFNSAYILGSMNLRTSSFKDHAASDMHQHAMKLLKKSQSNGDVSTYAPIAKALTTLDTRTEETVKKKFEIAYFLIKENLPYVKMAPLCYLIEKHGVGLGTGYKNDQACATFVQYIVKDQRLQLVDILSKAKFYSIQIDGSTDSANIEEEVFLIVYFNPHSNDGKVHIQDKFLAIRRPSRSNAEGLFECFTRALAHAGIIDWESKLVGIGCDGTNVNLGINGFRGYIEESVPWAVSFWCLVHRLELSLKDALKGINLYNTIDDMLMRAYYLYEKSPKKCHELDEVVASLRECLEKDEMYISRTKGNRPLRACGTRFVSHKVAAINRFIERYGAYINHLISLTEDSSVKPADKQKLKGYIGKWKEAKIIFGCAMFHDLLKPAGILCKALQYDDVSITDALEAMVKTAKSIEKLKTLNFYELPTVKKVISRIQNANSDSESISEATYQAVKLVHYEDGINFLTSHKDQIMESVLACLKNRVKAHHPELLTNVLKILATQGWNKSDDIDFASVNLDNLVQQFLIPLQKAAVDTSVINEEWEDMIEYARRYLNIAEEDHQTIWYKLFNCPDSSKWKNILALIELLFCLPMANGRVERAFSVMKIIKTDRRNCLGEDHLDDLMRIVIDGPALSQWNASRAVTLWWKDKQRRQVADKRVTVKPTSSSSVVELESDHSSEDEFDLEDWESFIA